MLKVEDYPANIANALENYCDKINEVTGMEGLNFQPKSKINFLSCQLLLQQFFFTSPSDHILENLELLITA